MQLAAGGPAPPMSDKPIPRAPAPDDLPSRRFDTRFFKVALLKRPFMRRVFDAKKLAELQKDIERRGLLDPPHCTPDGVVLSGNMRVEALLRLGVEEVECRVVRGLDTPIEQLAYAMSCDTKSDVSRADQALRLESVRREQPELTQKEIAAALGLSEASVSRLRSLLALPTDLVDAVIDGPLKLQHVTVLAKKPPEQKEKLLRKALAEGLTPKELAKSLRPPKRKPAEKTHTLPLAGVVVTWPCEWNWTQLDAALAELRNYLRSRVKGADVKQIDLPTILDAAKELPPAEGGAA